MYPLNLIRQGLGTLVPPKVAKALSTVVMLQSGKLVIRTAEKFWKTRKGPAGQTIPQCVITDALPRYEIVPGGGGMHRGGYAPGGERERERVVREGRGNQWDVVAGLA
jgi:hypothetical protein